MELKGEVAIVTGGGFGIGEQASLRLAREGVAVGVSDINIDNARRVAKEIIARGGQALAVKTDVCKSLDVKDMVRQVVETFGRVDILVNNVGVSPKGPKGEVEAANAGEREG